MLTLRPYQDDTIAAVEAGWAEGLHRMLIESPCGTGKTLVFAELIRRRGGRALIVAHRDELLEQAAAKVKMLWPEASVGIVKGGRDERDKQVVVASVQTVSRTRRALQPVFKTVIIDESHRAASDSYQAVLAQVGSFTDPEVLTLGVTATAERSDKKQLGSTFEKLVYRKSLLSAIQEGWLVDLRAKQVSISALQLGDVRTRNGDYVESDLGAAMRAADAPAKVADAYLKFGESLCGISFAPTVEIAQLITTELKARGIAAATVWGEQDLEERRRVLGEFAEGKYKIVSNVQVLGEGADFPFVEIVIMACPTKSRIRYVQSIGRATRTCPGKSSALILDMVGASAEHDLETMASLFGITQASAERGVLDTVRRAKEGEEVSGELQAADVKLFDRTKLHWIVDGRRFLLAAGESTLSLQQEGMTWSIYAIPRDYKQPKVKLYADLTMAYAQGVAEDYVRNFGAYSLAREGSSWRERPATDKQEKVLRRWDKYIVGMTAGMASDVIARQLVRKR
jgi:superfamily II DNA or RNA helicase